MTGVPPLGTHSVPALLLLPPCLAFLLSTVIISPAEAGPSVSPSIPSAHTLQAGERLSYSLSWLGINAGTAVMEIGGAPPIDGRATLTLRTNARSNKFISVFYPVDNRVESLVDAVRLTPLRTRFQRREGKRKNDFDYTFDHVDGTVLAIKDGVSQTLTIPPDSHDLLSCLYYFRSLPRLIPGTTLSLNVHHDRKNYRLQVTVEAIERGIGPWKGLEVVRVLARMPYQGIFLNEGNIRVWLTNDARHVPVRMKAKVIIGSVIATLVDGWEAP